MRSTFVQRNHNQSKSYRKISERFCRRKKGPGKFKAQGPDVHYHNDQQGFYPCKHDSNISLTNLQPNSLQVDSGSGSSLLREWAAGGGGLLNSSTANLTSPGPLSDTTKTRHICIMAYGRIYQACYFKEVKIKLRRQEWQMLPQEHTGHAWSISLFPTRFIKAPKNVIPPPLSQLKVVGFL